MRKPQYLGVMRPDPPGTRPKLERKHYLVAPYAAPHPPLDPALSKQAAAAGRLAAQDYVDEGFESYTELGLRYECVSYQSIVDLNWSPEQTEAYRAAYVAAFKAEWLRLWLPRA